MRRQQGWWTFELCVRKHVRQFHQEKDVVVRTPAHVPVLRPPERGLIRRAASHVLCARCLCRCRPQVSEYTLGRFDEEATAAQYADAAQPFMEEPSPTGAATRCVSLQATAARERPRSAHAAWFLTAARVRNACSFHAHVFTNGTPCDLTGEPRSTEVRFVCAPDSGAGSTSAATAPGEALAAHFIESVKEPTTCHYVLTFGTPLICKHTAFRVEEPPVSHIRCRALAESGGGGAVGGEGDSPASDAAAAVGAALLQEMGAKAAAGGAAARDGTEL
jgi:hypothetical protein